MKWIMKIGEQEAKSYYLCIRSQHSRGSTANRFGGPDTYVAVQIVPEGVTPLQSLQEQAAKKRGITIKYFGEGYSKYTGPRSSLGQAIEAAKAWIVKQQGGSTVITQG